MQEILRELLGGAVLDEEMLAAFAEKFVTRSEYDELRADRDELCGRLAAQETEYARRLWELRVEQRIEQLLLAAGARNLAAARALLDLAGLWDGPGGEPAPDWQERLAEQVKRLREEPETAFLFVGTGGGMQGWLGFAPAAADDEADSGNEGGFRLRLAQARGEQDSLAAIKVKQQAAARGVFL